VYSGKDPALASTPALRMLVYNLPQIGAIFDCFGGINGSAYFIGGCFYRKQYCCGSNPLRVCALAAISAT
jgi:hypothetical protein